MEMEMNETMYDRIWSYVVANATESSTVVSLWNEIKNKNIVPSSDDILFLRDVFDCISAALAYGMIIERKEDKK